MKRSILKITLATLGVLSIASCTDLELEDTDSVTRESTDGGFDGVSNVEGSINNAYNTIQGHLQTQENLYALQEATSDELLIPTHLFPL